MTAVLASVLAAGCGSKEEKAVKPADRGRLEYEAKTEGPYTGTMVEYWPGGGKKQETEYREGRKHGKSTVWYENGQVEWEGEYRDGDPVRFKHWTEDGRLIRTKK